MTIRSIGRMLSLGVFTLAVACAGSEQQAAEDTEQVSLPDTTAASVWTHLQAASYQESWELWPEKGQFYTGGEPHGMLLTTYVNETAHQAVMSKAGSLPVGAIVVKENYMPDSTLAAVTVMYKVAGYNAEHNDWFFIKRLADGTVEAEGRVAGCQGCHGAAKDNDYILTASLSR